MGERKKKTRTKEDLTKLVEEYEKELYDSKQLIQISISLNSEVLNYSTLMESILYTCMGQMRVLGASMFVLKSFDSNELTLDDNYNGFDPDNDVIYTIPIDSKFVQFLSKENLTYTIEELKTKLGEKKIPKQITSLNPSLIVPLKAKNHLNGILLLGDRIMLEDDVQTYTEYERNQISTIASLAAISINNTSLIEQSTTDIMTHLKLKHYFYQVLADKIDSCSKRNIPISVLMLDIDFFKKFNDTYGHACGDYVLQSISKIIKEQTRSEDLAGRYGGEEFVVMLYDTPADGAITVAE
ncbi:MAG: sensor domain-containing diguanylate cyclase, partial [Treponemataceae bacterium]|nr:sensor domain-containing diguanylate cyclase [Treponemataceae bacterium]